MDAALRLRLDALVGLVALLALVAVVQFAFRFGARGLAVLGFLAVMVAGAYAVARPSLPGRTADEPTD